jgi:hypothetical protein
MILEHQLRIVGFAGVVIATGLVAVHARACSSHGPSVVTIPVPVAVTQSPAVATTTAPITPTIPTVTMRCMDSTTKLLVDAQVPVLCWGDHCLAYRDDAPTSVPPPASVPPPENPAAEAGAVVSADRVCTGAHCDPLGPKLRAAIADIDPSDLSATRDHAAIVIGHEVWNRANDRPIDLGKPTMDEGEVVSIDVIGNRLIVARSCNEWCSAIASIIDARGRSHGPQFASNPGWGGDATRILAVGDDRFVVFGRFGEIAMIAHGQSVATADFLPTSSGAPYEVMVHALVLGNDTIAAQWCTSSMCHLTRISFGGTEPGSDRAYLGVQDDVPLPPCPE